VAGSMDNLVDATIEWADALGRAHAMPRLRAMYSLALAYYIARRRAGDSNLDVFRRAHAFARRYWSGELRAGELERVEAWEVRLALESGENDDLVIGDSDTAFGVTIYLPPKG
jgi:hypothetical protein